MHNARNLSNDFTRKLPRDETLKANVQDGSRHRLNRIANVCKIFVRDVLKRRRRELAEVRSRLIKA